MQVALLSAEGGAVLGARPRCRSTATPLVAEDAPEVFPQRGSPRPPPPHIMHVPAEQPREQSGTRSSRKGNRIGTQRRKRAQR